MTRREAAAATALVGLGCCLLAYAVERWPNATIAGVSLAAIYTSLRASNERGAPDGDCD